MDGQAAESYAEAVRELDSYVEEQPPGASAAVGAAATAARLEQACAVACYKLGRPAEARRRFDGAAARYVAVRGEGHAETGAALMKAGAMHLEAQSWELARELSRRAHECLLACHGAEHKQTAMARRNLDRAERERERADRRQEEEDVLEAAAAAAAAAGAGGDSERRPTVPAVNSAMRVQTEQLLAEAAEAENALQNRVGS